jgi:hypothetical protein
VNAFARERLGMNNRASLIFVPREPAEAPVGADQAMADVS